MRLVISSITNFYHLYQLPFRFSYLIMRIQALQVFTMIDQVSLVIKFRLTSNVKTYS